MTRKPVRSLHGAWAGLGVLLLAVAMAAAWAAYREPSLVLSYAIDLPLCGALSRRLAPPRAATPPAPPPQAAAPRR